MAIARHIRPTSCVRMLNFVSSTGAILVVFYEVPSILFQFEFFEILTNLKTSTLQSSFFWPFKCTPRRPASNHNFLTRFQFFINFCKSLKNEKSGLNLVFKGVPQILSPPLLSACLGILDLATLFSRVKSSRYNLHQFLKNV